MPKKLVYILGIFSGYISNFIDGLMLCECDDFDFSDNDSNGGFKSRADVLETAAQIAATFAEYSAYIDSQNKKNAFALTDRTDEFAPADISENRVMGILAYISWLVLIPIFAAKGSKFARFHANQGLIIAIAGTALTIAQFILLLLLGRLWILKLIIRLLFLAPQLFLVVLTVLGIVNAARGRAKELPLIGKIRILK